MIEDVWTTDKEVHLGFVGTIKDMLKENLLTHSDYEGDTWLFLPSMGVMHHAQYGRSKEEALEPLKREVGEVILATPRTEEKALLLKSMHEIISHLNNEDAYDQWIYTVPDGASDEDFHEIAEDSTLFQDSCQLFVCLMNDYLEDGIYIDKQLFAIEPEHEEHDPAPYVITTPGKLRQLCIDENWFTSGSNEQYGKLFYANANGCPMEEIATIIWVCSSNADRSGILATLKLEQERYHQAISIQEQDQSMER